MSAEWQPFVLLLDIGYVAGVAAHAPHQSDPDVTGGSIIKRCHNILQASQHFSSAGIRIRKTAAAATCTPGAMIGVNSILRASTPGLL